MFIKSEKNLVETEMSEYHNVVILFYKIYVFKTVLKPPKTSVCSHYKD
jgi:hypothetical protein